MCYIFVAFSFRGSSYVAIFRCFNYSFQAKFCVFNFRLSNNPRKFVSYENFLSTVVNNEMDSVSIESCVRWNISGTLQGGRKSVPHKETHSTHNLLYAVVLMKGDVVIRHITTKIAAACPLFLDKENTTVIVNSTGAILWGDYQETWSGCAVSGMDYLALQVIKAENKTAFIKATKLAKDSSHECLPLTKNWICDFTHNKKTILYAVLGSY